jgi:ribosome-binding factor A
MTRPRQQPGQGHRREQLASELREVLQDQFTRGLSDPRIQGLITITSVQIDQELTRALVRVSVLPEKNQARVIAGLKHGSKHLRHKAGEKIVNVRIPELIFEIDTSLKKQAAVIEALAKVAREREQKESLDAGAGAGNNEGQEDAGDAAAPGQPDRERGD